MRKACWEMAAVALLYLVAAIDDCVCRRDKASKDPYSKFLLCSLTFSSSASYCFSLSLIQTCLPNSPRVLRASRRSLTAGSGALMSCCLSPSVSSILSIATFTSDGTCFHPILTQVIPFAGVTSHSLTCVARFLSWSRIVLSLTLLPATPGTALVHWPLLSGPLL